MVTQHLHPPPKTTVDIAITDIKERYSISDEEALIIRDVCGKAARQNSVSGYCHK